MFLMKIMISVFKLDYENVFIEAINLTSWYICVQYNIIYYLLYKKKIIKCIYFIAWKFHQKSDSKTSRNLFRFSLIHLPALMILLFVNKHGLWSGNRYAIFVPN